MSVSETHSKVHPQKVGDDSANVAILKRDKIRFESTLKSVLGKELTCREKVRRDIWTKSKSRSLLGKFTKLHRVKRFSDMVRQI